MTVGPPERARNPPLPDQHLHPSLLTAYTVKRALRAHEKPMAADHRAGEALFVQVVLCQDFELVTRAHNARGASFVGEVDFAVGKHGRRKEIATEAFLPNFATGPQLNAMGNTAVVDKIEAVLVNQRGRDVSYVPG